MQYLKQIQPHLPNEMVSDLTYFAQRTRTTNLLDINGTKKSPVYLDKMVFWNNEKTCIVQIKLLCENCFERIEGLRVFELIIIN